MHIRDYLQQFPRGKRLKEVKRLAKACGVGQTAIYFWVCGRNHVSFRHMPKLEKATKKQVTRMDMWADN